MPYRVRDFLLFNARTYERLFARYNEQWWPLHVVAIAIGVAILVLMLRRAAPRVMASLLAIAWLWSAWAFLFSRYDAINWAAKYFAIAFVVEAALLLIGKFEARRDWLGIALFVFALFVVPWLSSRREVFGMTPDPTVVATLGVLIAARRWWLMIIPLSWCFISGATLWTLYHR